MSLAAPALTKRPPRSARAKLGGYVILPRLLDKGRATIRGKNGEFRYDCPIDQHILKFLNVSAKALLKELKKGKGDGEILTWITKNQKNKLQPWEIEVWSSYHEKRGPDSDQVTATFFTGRLDKLGGAKREDIKTWFDLLDLDDHVTFGGKP
jgi:hypothetical protein